VDAPDKDLAQYFQLTWINDSGLVIQQYIGKDGHSHTAALSGRKWTVLDVPGATDTGGTNPNSQGQVALSYSEDNMITWHLAIWQRGHYTYLPDPPPGYLSRGAQGINDRGLVSAGALDPLGNILGDLVDGGRHRFFSYPGSDNTTAFMTNDPGTTVGQYVDADGNGHGFIKDGTRFVSLDYPGGPEAIGTYAFFINNEGDIVGDYWDTNLQAVLGFQLQRGHFTPFDVPGAAWVTLVQVTDNHIIAGTYMEGDGLSHGFIAVPVGGRKARVR
jgi:uncharacterized membrane protein